MHTQTHRPKANIIFTMLALALLLSLSGCMKQSGVTPTQQLQLSVQQFHNDMRWKRYEQASALLPLEQREKFLRYYEKRRDELFITDFELTRFEPHQDGIHARTTIILSWYELPSSIVKTSTIDESWVFQSKQGWTLVEQKRRPETLEELRAARKQLQPKPPQLQP